MGNKTQKRMILPAVVDSAGTEELSRPINKSCSSFDIHKRLVSAVSQSPKTPIQNFTAKLNMFTAWCTIC